MADGMLVEASAEARRRELLQAVDGRSPRWGYVRHVAWSLVLPAAVAAIVVAAWQLDVSTLHTSLVPTPTNVARGFWTSMTSSADWAESATSWLSLAIGYAISAVGGVAIGVLLGWKRGLDRTLGVYVDLAMVVPEIVMMPIILIALGVTRKAEVVVIIMFSAPYVIMPIRNGVRALPAAWIDLSMSLCATRRQLWRHVLLPGSREVIAAGLRIGLGHALTGLLVVELTLVSLGIGKVVTDYQSAYEFGPMFGYILLVMCQVFVIMGLISLVEAKSRYR